MARARKYGKKARAKTTVESPLPTAPELLRGLARALDVRGEDGSGGRLFDEYVRKGQYVHELHVKLLKEGILAPLGNVLSAETVDFLRIAIEHSFKQYHSFALNYDAVDMNRSTVIRISTPLFLICWSEGWSLLEQHFPFPGPPELCSSSNVMANAISWLEENCIGWQGIVDQYKDQNEEKINYVNRWKNGTKLPSFQSLKLLAGCASAREREKVFLVLLVGRAIAFLCRNHDGLGRKISYIASTEVDSFDPLKIGVETVEASLKYDDFVCHIENVNDLFRRAIMNGEGADEVLHALLEAKAFHRKAKLPTTSRWRLHWMWGRYAIANGCLNEAVSEYEKAFGLSLYSAGNAQDVIIREALVVASWSGKVKLLERIKNQAIAFGIIQADITDEDDPGEACGESRRKNTFVKDWEIRRWQQDFDTVFPPDFMLQGCVRDWEDAESSVIILDPAKHSKPDLQHPNRVVKYKGEGGSIKKPQVLYYAWKNDFSAVKKLVKKGADFVTPWKGNGESVFHFAVRWMNRVDALASPDESLYAFILPRIEALANEKGHDCPVRKMVCTPYLKKQFTVLGSAVETCDPKVVEKVLSLGAAVDQGHTMDKFTPLYQLCSLMDSMFNLEKRRWAMQEHLKRMSPGERAEIMRRYGVPHNGEGVSPRAMNLMMGAMEVEQGKLLKIGKNPLLAIAEVLLDHGADPNAFHSVSNVEKRTPLMMAIESGDIDLFELLLKYGGDASLTCFSHIDYKEYSCLEVAAKFGGAAMVERVKDELKSQYNNSC